MRPHRNITKTVQHKYVRPSRRQQIPLKIETSQNVKKEDIKVNTQDIKEVEIVKEEVKENKKTNKKEDMNNVDMKQVDALLQGEEAKLPKRKVKVEKKDRGLFERTENSKLILTEDNKMLLND